jgi:hypothetical protein
VRKTIASYVGLDIHKDSIAIAVADAGRDARCVPGCAAALREPSRQAYTYSAFSRECSGWTRTGVSGCSRVRFLALCT